MSEVSKKKATKTAVNKPAVKAAKTEEIKYSKLGLLSLSKFSTTDKDIINIVLNDKDRYTLNEVKNLIKKFKEGI